MIKIGIIGCGLQAATIVSYMSCFGDEYEVSTVADINLKNAEDKLALMKVNVAQNCRFYDSLESYLADPVDIDAYVIGTFCKAHTPTACALEKFHKPIFIEKPVAVSFEQVQQLYDTFSESETPVMVSLPMRVCPLAKKAKILIDSGLTGKINQIVGIENTSGEIYFSTWFREVEKTGGMFLQKAVHDLDYMFYLADSMPESVCAMSSTLQFGGSKSADLTCDVCPDSKTCKFGPMAKFDDFGSYESYSEAVEKMKNTVAHGGINKKRYCLLSQAAGIEDSTSCIIRLRSGVTLTHTQNFTVTGHSSRREARLICERGVLTIDYNKSEIRFESSVNHDEMLFKVDAGRLSHYGGDRKLVKAFLDLIKSGRRAETDLILGNGLYSTLAGIASHASAQSGCTIGKSAFTLIKGKKHFPFENSLTQMR